MASQRSMLSLLKKPKAKPRRVDFFLNNSDHETALLGAMGMSTKFIMERSGLSKCQVTYRLTAAGLTHANNASRMDFRNGVSPFSAVMMNAISDHVDRDLKRFLKKHLET